MQQIIYVVGRVEECSVDQCNDRYHGIGDLLLKGRYNRPTKLQTIYGGCILTSV
jgi:hypothetical protein